MFFIAQTFTISQTASMEALKLIYCPFLIQIDACRTFAIIVFHCQWLFYSSPVVLAVSANLWPISAIILP